MPDLGIPASNILAVEPPGYAAVVTSDTIVICKDEKLYTRQIDQSAHLFGELKTAINREAKFDELLTILSAYGPK